ncbi:MAG: class I tRNA ligase family protein [Aureliella sp.]
MSHVSGPRFVKNTTRPEFPKRAIVTAGMPYGNKDLHFGHVGGVFIHADAYARFLRDRIGAENVIFVSGTDCYGSPIVADHADKVQKGEFSGSLLEFVQANHQRQADTLAAYSISVNNFAASALEPYVDVHRDMGAHILETLHRNGHLQKLTTSQFYDVKKEMFLNGRQVVGRCPIEGCQSEKGYADECSLGHQYEPSELINPISTLTGEKPEMRDVTNWYLNVEKFRDALTQWLDRLDQSQAWREFAIREVREYFGLPALYIKRDDLEQVDEAALVASLPPHEREPSRSKSDKFIFKTLADRDRAKAELGKQNVRYRAGRTLVPFRLTGNLDWGLPAPVIDGLEGLTFWVWPESLWAPISFTASCLAQTGRPASDWKYWWSSKDAQVNQFIGEDNLFFYGLAEMAMFLGMQGEQFASDPPEGDLQLPKIIANHHLLVLDKKASSSGKVKPPSARDLLQWYTSDQLRMHFLSLGLGLKHISFRPKPLDPKASSGSADPVLKDGNILSNSLNKAVRSCFYTVQKFYDSKLPRGLVSDDIVEQSENVILAFEQAMAAPEFHTGIEKVGAFIRDINKLWTEQRPYADDCPDEQRKQALIDAFHMVRVAVTLLHPVAPVGTEKVREQLGIGPELWDWSRIFDPLESFIGPEHQFAHLPQRVDFFDKTEYQIAE